MSERLLIAGVPRAGKTTLALELGGRVRHTDDLVHLSLEQASVVVAAWLSEPGPWTIEGVTVQRGLRVWLAANEGRPCDRVLWLGQPRVELTPGQRRWAKGCQTVWSQVHPELVRRGVPVEVVR